MKAIKIGLLLGCLALFGCKQVSVVTEAENAPKNVILLIGDGTGLSQVSAAFYFKETSPNYARFQDIGLIITSSSRQDVTDSAASGTAFACGVKSYNGAIGVGNDSAIVKNIVEIASLKNIKTGLVASSSITHATPASFFAHNINRGNAEAIASDMIQSEIDFFAGGGLQFFNKRKDSRNLLNELRDINFTINTTALDNFSKIRSEEKMAYLLAQDALPPVAEGRGPFLPDATDLAIKFLSKDDSGFFMMTEGSQVDWGGHGNDSNYLITELNDFDDAIGKALDYAEKSGNTLVIVTADHETGGFTLGPKKKLRANGSEYSDYSEIEPVFATGGHSATLIPVFAYGPGSEEFKGVYQNNEIFHKILKVTKWGAANSNLKE